MKNQQTLNKRKIIVGTLVAALITFFLIHVTARGITTLYGVKHFSPTAVAHAVTILAILSTTIFFKAILGHTVNNEKERSAARLYVQYKNESFEDKTALNIMGLMLIFGFISYHSCSYFTARHGTMYQKLASTTKVSESIFRINFCQREYIVEGSDFLGGLCVNEVAGENLKSGNYKLHIMGHESLLGSTIEQYYAAKNPDR